MLYSTLARASLIVTGQDDDYPGAVEAAAQKLQSGVSEERVRGCRRSAPATSHVGLGDGAEQCPVDSLLASQSNITGVSEILNGCLCVSSLPAGT